MPILDFNRRTQSCRSLLLNDSMGFCTGDDLPWEEWENVPYGSRYFRSNGDEWKKILPTDQTGPSAWEPAISFPVDVGKVSFNQQLHGFTSARHPIPVYTDGQGKLQPAIASSRSTLSQLFIRNVININELEIYAGSNVIKFPNHDLQIGKTYYTSSTVPGGITVDEPTISNPLYIALDSERILMLSEGQIPSKVSSINLPACKVLNSKNDVNLVSQTWSLLRDLDTFNINDDGLYDMTYAGCIKIPEDGRYEITFQPHFYASNSMKMPEFCITVNGFLTDLRSVGTPIKGTLQLAKGNSIYVLSRTIDKKGTVYLRDILTTSLYIQQVR